MSGAIPYIIAFNGRIVGKLYGQAIAISANCMNVTVLTTQYYSTLNFSSSSTRSTRGLRLAWWLLHQNYHALTNTHINRGDYIDAFAILHQLGVPLEPSRLTLTDRLYSLPLRCDDPSAEARKRELFQLLFRGVHYPMTVGKTKQIIYGSLTMMARISKLFARLVDNTRRDHLSLIESSFIPHISPENVVTSEIWNTWL